MTSKRTRFLRALMWEKHGLRQQVNGLRRFAATEKVSHVARFCSSDDEIVRLHPGARGSRRKSDNADENQDMNRKKKELNLMILACRYTTHGFVAFKWNREEKRIFRRTR